MGKPERRQVVAASALAGAKVFDVEGQEGCRGLRLLAVFATVSGSLANALPPLSDHPRCLGRAGVFQQRARLGLQDGDEMEGGSVRVVFGPLFVGQLPLVGLVCEFVHPGLRGRIRAQIGDPTGDFPCQAAGERVEDPVEDVGMCGLCHGAHPCCAKIALGRRGCEGAAAAMPAC